MAYDPNKYHHHHRRLMVLIDACNDACSRSYVLEIETGYHEGNWRTPDPRIVQLRKLIDRLRPLIDRASQRRDRFASTERWTPYRAWPY
jgi:hypothetical protein